LRRIVTENVTKIFTTISGSVAKRGADAIRGSLKWPWGKTEEDEEEEAAVVRAP
jgi:hypothetical protein